MLFNCICVDIWNKRFDVIGVQLLLLFSNIVVINTGRKGPPGPGNLCFGPQKTVEWPLI